MSPPAFLCSLPETTTTTPDTTTTTFGAPASSDATTALAITTLSPVITTSSRKCMNSPFFKILPNYIHQRPVLVARRV